MSFPVKTEKYEGPLDLLLDLIKRNKVDICDISLMDITEQYINAVLDLKYDMDKMSDFLLMTSKLIELKSEYLLYLKREIEEDPTEEIKMSLEIYKTYKSVTQYLKTKEIDLDGIFSRKPAEIFTEEEFNLEEMTLSKLFEITDRIIKRKNTKHTIISFKFPPVEEMIKKIKTYLEKNNKAVFFKLQDKEENAQKVAIFLSLLEITHSEHCHISQNKKFGEISVETTGV